MGQSQVHLARSAVLLAIVENDRAIDSANGGTSCPSDRFSGSASARIGRLEFERLSIQCLAPDTHYDPFLKEDALSML